MAKYYGVYNNHKKEFQFNICESSKRKATAALFKKIGNDARKWRFEIKELKFGNPKAELILRKHVKVNNTQTHNAVIIPKNATNGDMIKIMFNPYKICEYEHSVHVYMTEEDFWKADYQINCDTSWWNAPYRKGVKYDKRRTAQRIRQRHNSSPVDQKTGKAAAKSDSGEQLQKP